MSSPRRGEEHRGCRFPMSAWPVKAPDFTSLRPSTTYFQCTLINFIATEKGLEDQLLAKVVGVERPELEKQAQELQSAFNQVTAGHEKKRRLHSNCVWQRRIPRQCCV